MKLIHSSISAETALSKQVLRENGLSFVWYQEDSRTGFERAEEQDLSMDHLIEARAFGNGKEIHVFPGIDGTLRAVLTIQEEDGEENWYDEKVVLRAGFGRTLTIRHWIGHDEDGLAYPSEAVFQDYEPEEAEG